MVFITKMRTISDNPEQYLLKILHNKFGNWLTKKREVLHKDGNLEDLLAIMVWGNPRKTHLAGEIKPKDPDSSGKTENRRLDRDLKRSFKALEKSVRQDPDYSLEYQDIYNIVLYSIRRLLEFCQEYYLQLLHDLAEYDKVKSLWPHFSRKYPQLKREAFDTRTSRCRSTLKKLLGNRLKI